MELRRFAGRPYYVFRFGAFESVTVAADGKGGAPFVRYPTEALVAQARQAVQGPLASADLLEGYDAYYYSVGTGGRRRLPVLRLTFDDPETRLMYVDPHTGSSAHTAAGGATTKRAPARSSRRCATRPISRAAAWWRWATRPTTFSV